jgi:lipocalin
MSTPTSKWLWIMARRPVVSSSLRAALVARARNLGYDTTRLVYDQQPPA